jgi:2-amino-4-hydroxy-6-hydroxymethyldihydropteridine diphosphokinase
VEFEAVSSVYETEAQYYRDQPNFLNCVAHAKTVLGAYELLRLCQGIEQEIGKNKTSAFGPRCIDIDILTFNSETTATLELILPHPRMHERNFVLSPLKEIAPNFRINGIHIDVFLPKVADQKVVKYVNQHENVESLRSKFEVDEFRCHKT